MALQAKRVNLNQVVRLDPDGTPVTLTAGNGLKAFNHPFNRDNFPDDDLGFNSKHTLSGAFDFLQANLVFNARLANWVFTTFETYWRAGSLVRIDQLHDKDTAVGATNLRYKFQGRIYQIGDSGVWNQVTEVTIPFHIFQASYSSDDATFTDVTTGSAITWET